MKPEASEGDSSALRGEAFVVTVSVDGKPLPLKAFLHDMIGGAVLGLVSGLRGVDVPAAVEVSVRRR